MDQQRTYNFALNHMDETELYDEELAVAVAEIS